MTLSTTFDLQELLSRHRNGWTTFDYKAGKYVFCQGETADSVYYLGEGKVKLNAVSPQGKEAILGLCESRGFFGEACLSGPDRRHATAVTLTECKGFRFEREFMKRLLAEDSRFASLLLQHLIARVPRMEEDLLDQLFNSIEKRLARALVRVSKTSNSATPDQAVGKVNQEMLAAMIGATRTRVNFFMNKFREQGHIDYGEKLIVNRSLVNQYLTD